MRLRSHPAFLAGLAAPVLWSVGVLAATVHEHAYLDSIGWSAIHRSPVEWPSVLMIGPDGWLVSALFVACGILALVFVIALSRVARESVPTTVTLTLILLGLAVSFVALPPDAPAATDLSWHGRMHNWTYPAIPLLAILGQLRLAAGWGDRQRLRRSLAALSLLLLPISIGGLVASNIAAVAQLGRYFLFGSIACWLAGLSLIVADVSRPAQRYAR